MSVLRMTCAAGVAALMLSTLTTPSLAAGKKHGGNDFGQALSSFFDFDGGKDFKKGKGKGRGEGYGGDNHEGKGGKHHHGNVTFQDNPGVQTGSASNTIVYFGVCLNLAGVQQAGNAGPDGYCLPYESLVGSEVGVTSPTCTITKTWGGGSGYETSSFGRKGGSKGGGHGGGSSTETVEGSCSAYQAANPPHEKPHDKPDGGYEVPSEGPVAN